MINLAKLLIKNNEFNKARKLLLECIFIEKEGRFKEVANDIYQEIINK